jgi:tRNA nucleotidyltransferase (CCA-adding enzyme)
VTKFKPPEEVVRIARTLEDAGFETWCVGGGIRDALLGEPHLDWDLATAAKPDDVRRLFPRTVPVGIEFGTVGVLDNKNEMHEVTTFRRDVNTDGRHAVVEFGASLEDDLARRDYTINAIAYSPTRDEVRDPFDGLTDLNRRVVRAVGEPSERMREDRLRALRAIRFAARFGFEIDQPTWDAIVASAAHLKRLSAERVKQEIEKTMDQVRTPSKAFQMWRDSGALAVLVPPLANADDLDLSVIDYVRRPGDTGSSAKQSARKLARIAALFAAALPGEVAGTVKKLRFSNSEVKWLSSVIATTQDLAPEMKVAFLNIEAPPDSAIRHWAAIAGRTRFAFVLRLANARWCAEREAGMVAPREERVSSVYRRAIKIAYRDAIEVGDLAIGGDELGEIGIKGPAVGSVLRNLLENVINDPSINTREKLLELAPAAARSLGAPNLESAG